MADTVVPFVDLGPATRAVSADLLVDLEGLIVAGLFVNGPYVERFESAFAAATGSLYCVGVASGLDALRLALIALDLEPGDEVIVPAMTFIATFEAVVQAGARCVVVDVSGSDLCLDPAGVAASITDRTRCVLPVHLYGQMADIRALAALTASKGIALLEDACQAHGATRDGIRAGIAGTAAAYSFYPSKNLGAMGDAGALVTEDETLAAQVRALRQHGEATRYRSDYVGYTARLDAMQALVLTHKLPHLDGWNRQRGEAAAVYSRELLGVGDLVLPTAVAGADHVWHLYTVRTAKPEALAEFLGARGVATGRHYPQPPHLSAAFRDLHAPDGTFPVAEAVARETLSLPIFPGITEAQLAAVVEATRGFFAGG